MRRMPSWFITLVKLRTQPPQITDADRRYLTWLTARDQHGREWADQHCL